MIDLAAFIGKYLGAANTGNTQINKGQCVGLVELWLLNNNKPAIWANAVDLLDTADKKYYKKVVNIPTNEPPPGAVVCWDSTWGNGYGHTAIVVAANVLELVVFEQNNPLGYAPIVSTHGYSHVTGWLKW